MKSLAEAEKEHKHKLAEIKAAQPKPVPPPAPKPVAPKESIPESISNAQDDDVRSTYNSFVEAQKDLKKKH